MSGTLHLHPNVTAFLRAMSSELFRAVWQTIVNLNDNEPTKFKRISGTKNRFSYIVQSHEITFELHEKSVVRVLRIRIV